MNNTEFLEYLRKFVSDAGSQKKAAENLEISTAYLNDILRGRREPGRKICEAFGLRKVITYVQNEGPEWKYL